MRSTRLRRVFFAGGMAALVLFAQLVLATDATVYKNPQCGCCKEHVAYLRQHGFKVTTVDMDDLTPIKRKYHVPAMLEGCHTTVIDGYAIEGHVPASAIKRLLSERPPINDKFRGISLPGMPPGSPGMGGEKTEPFVIYEISEGAPRVYAKE